MPIDLTGLDRADVLAALYNASKPLGMGFMQYDPAPMTTEEAREMLAKYTYFDYLKGRVMKVDLSDDQLDPRLYDRDNGQGAAERVIAILREEGDTNAAAIRVKHTLSTAEAADDARAGLQQPAVFENESGIPTLHMGLADVADALGPKLDAIPSPDAADRPSQDESAQETLR